VLTHPRPAARSAGAKGRPLGSGEKVDLNRASVAELMRLPGIGRKRAEAIAALRARKPLRRAEDVAEVKGISPQWVARNRALLEVAPPSGAPPPGAGSVAKP
jgi:competence protein ComEA